MGFFGAAYIWGRGRLKAPPSLLPKICYIYSTMMKLYSCNSPKENLENVYIYHVTHSLSSADISIFLIGNWQFSLYQEILTKISFWCIFSNYFDFYRIFTGFLIDLIVILMSAKSATPGLLEIKVFLNKVYVIISVNYPTKILSRDLNYIAIVVI